MRVGSKSVILTAAGMTAVWVVSVVLAASGPAASNVSVRSSTERTASGDIVLPLAGSIVWAQAAAAAAQTPANAALLTENVFKNIQVLKGIPVDDFMGTMGLMSAALAFCCSDCHPNAGTDFVKWEEDSPIKRTARRMVTMVNEINRASFGGRQVVTCWTCHRGRDKPVMTPALDAVYGEPELEPDDVLVRAQGVPTVDQVLDKYLTAIGGAQRLNTLTSYVATGASVGFGGFGGGGVVEIYAKAPNQRAVHISFPNDPDRGDDTRTFDGRTGWIATPLAVVRQYELAGPELDGARVDAQLAFPGQIKTLLTNMRVSNPTFIDERVVQVLQGNAVRGTIVTLFFDNETGLLRRVVRMVPSPIGKVPTQVDYADYRDVGGIKFPHSQVFSWLDGKSTFEIKNIQLNATIDPARFGKPDPLAR